MRAVSVAIMIAGVAVIYFAIRATPAPNLPQGSGAPAPAGTGPF